MLNLTRLKTGFGCMLLLLFLLPQTALAIPAITCHCFTDRSYDPSRPAVADPYILATSQNSFFAAAFGVEKKTIVIKKQKGVAADDLWISYWLAAKSGSDPESLMRERTSTGSWRKVASRVAVSAKSMGSRFTEAIAVDAPDERLAAAVVDELLLRFRFHGEKELSALRKAGAGNQELILAGLISAKNRQPAISIYREVKSGSSSWGSMLQLAKINTTGIQAEITTLLIDK